jgi:hypothetical protein
MFIHPHIHTYGDEFVLIDSTTNQTLFHAYSIHQHMNNSNHTQEEDDEWVIAHTDEYDAENDNNNNNITTFLRGGSSPNYNNTNNNNQQSSSLGIHIDPTHKYLVRAIFNNTSGKEKIGLAQMRIIYALPIGMDMMSNGMNIIMTMRGF